MLLLKLLPGIFWDVVCEAKTIPLLLFRLEKKEARNLSGTDRSQLVQDILGEVAGISDGIIRDDIL